MSSNKEVKRGRFASIVQAAAAAEAEAEAEPVKLEVAPQPEPIPAPEPPTKVVPIAPVQTAAQPVSKVSSTLSKRSTMKQVTFYVPKELSLDLDAWLMQVNRNRPASDAMDRSDVVTILLETLVKLGKVKGTSALYTIEALQRR